MTKSENEIEKPTDRYNQKSGKGFGSKGEGYTSSLIIMDN